MLRLIGMICCWSLLLSVQAAWAGLPNTLSGLSEGKVFFNVVQPPARVELRYRPIYGWDEPILLFGPGGRIIARQRLGHTTAGRRAFRLAKGAGIYVLLLKPSYSYQVAATSAAMVFSPAGQSPALFQSHGARRLTFRVPEGTAQLAVSFANVFKLKGSAARLTLFDPAGRQVAVRNRPGFDRDAILRQATGASYQELLAGQKGSDITLAVQPAATMATRIEIDAPQSGFWSLAVGTLKKSGGRIGIRLEGVPNYLAGSAQHWFEPLYQGPGVPVSARIKSLDPAPRPFLGMVGHLGRPHEPDGNLFKSFGQQADKLFIRPRDMIITEKGLTLRHAERYDPEHGSYSLVVMRSLDQAAHPAALCHQTARMLLVDMGRRPDTFALQVFNEPNQVFDLEEYLSRFLDCARAVKKDPAFSGIRFAGPGLGSGAEQDILDWPWIRKLIQRADPYVDLISWNLYRVKDPQDTYLYTQAIEKLWAVIRQADQDGQAEPILIGATNRKGGLCPDELFKGPQAALWWASTLCQVISTGKVKGIYYYNSVDHEGWGRKKGMFDDLLQPKPQAHVHKMFADLLGKKHLYAVRSDHGFLEGLAAKEAGQMQMILLNKGWQPLNIDLNPNGPWTVRRLGPDGGLDRIPWAAPLKMGARQILLLTKP